MVETKVNVKCSREECSFEGEVTLKGDESLKYSNCKGCGSLGSMKQHNAEN